MPDAKADLNAAMKQVQALYKAQPAVMKGMHELHESALTDGELSKATKELMALAISIHTKCEGCILTHLSGAIKAGATKAQIDETLGVAVMMSGGPGAIYAAKALDAAEQMLG